MTNTEKNNPKPEKLHIFINNVKFEAEDGVKPVMTGRELAALVKVPEKNASITRKNSDGEIGLDEEVQIKMADHFEILRDKVLAGFNNPAVAKPLHVQRIEKELTKLYEKAGIKAYYIKCDAGEFVKYVGIETGGKRLGLPEVTDVLTRVPDGYPSAYIDMPALPTGSPLLKRVVGASNPQGTVMVEDCQWLFVSYHPYNSDQGGFTWNPSQHGFDHYAVELYQWLKKLV